MRVIKHFVEHKVTIYLRSINEFILKTFCLFNKYKELKKSLSVSLKILINKEGKVEDTFASFTNPMSKKIINKLEEIL